MCRVLVAVELQNRVSNRYVHNKEMLNRAPIIIFEATTRLPVLLKAYTTFPDSSISTVMLGDIMHVHGATYIKAG